MNSVIDNKPFELLNSANGADDLIDAPREFDYVQIALRHKWLLLIGLLAGFGLGNLAFVKLGPEYNAVAKILVSKPTEVSTKDAIVTAFQERTEHVAIIKSPMLVGKAIEKGQLAKLPSLRSSTEPIEDILDCLEVKRTAGQDQSYLNVFEITYRNKNRDDARAAVNAIILAYKDYLKDSQEEADDKLATLMEKMDSYLSQQIAQKQQQLLEFRKDAPLQWRSVPGDKRQPGDVTNVHQERVLEIERDRRLNLLKRAEINGKIKALQNAIDEGRPHEELENLVRLLMATAQPGQAAGAAVTAAGTPVGMTQAEQASNQLLPLLLEEQRLLRDFADDHPDVQNVRKSIAKVKEFYDARGVSLPELSSRNATVQKIDLVSSYMRFLRQQLAELDLKDEELTRLYDAETKLAKGIVKFQVEDQALSEELERLKTTWNEYVKKFSEHDLIHDKGYTLKLLAPVREEWSLKRYLKIVGAATLLLLSVCVGIVFQREWRDTTVKSTDDVRTLMHGAAMLGSVPRFQFDPQAVDPAIPLQPALCYFHRPGSAEAEAYRSVRTALLNGLDNNQKVIQISSPEPGDGKSTFISNLAIALAQSGKKVLLLDADLRRPTLHRLFRARQEIGTTEFLTGEIQFVNAVQESSVKNLWLLTAGTSPPNPAETLSSERLERLFAEARTEFDFVLIDSPPLLVVSDPCISVSHTDGLLLVVRTNKNTRVVLRQTRDLIRQHGINLLGVVANAVDPDASGGYGSGYSKGYSDYLQPSSPAMRPMTPDSCQPVRSV